MGRRSITPKRQAERDFAFRVDILVPSRMGLGNRLDGMHKWCNDNENAGKRRWFPYGGLGPRDEHGIQQQVAMFYFHDEATAEAFQACWGGELSRTEG